MLNKNWADDLEKHAFDDRDVDPSLLPSDEETLRTLRDTEFGLWESVTVQELVVKRSFSTNNIQETIKEFDRRAAEMYTKEEQEELCLATGSGTKVLKLTNHAAQIKELRDVTLTVENFGLVEMLFATLPIEELPFHLDAKKKRIEIIVKWRLEHGK